MKTINLNSFGFIRVGAVSPKLKVGDIQFNVNQIEFAISKVKEKHNQIIVFPELCITSYTCGDLFFQDNLLKECRNAIIKLEKITAETSTNIIVGAPLAASDRLFNCAIFISQGKTIGVVPKTYLCNNGEYYEERWFSSELDRIDNTIKIGDNFVPFGANLLFEPISNHDIKIGIELCEDLWATVPPSSEQALFGANIIFNLSASNEYLGKAEYRRNLVISQSARCITAYIYCSSNAGESSTDLVYGGHKLIAENGKILTESERFTFETDIIYADIDVEMLKNYRLKTNSFADNNPKKEFKVVNFYLNDLKDHKLLRVYPQTPFVPQDANKRAETCKEIFAIQTTALAKRLIHINTKSAVIGISGGLDSTLALLACYKTFQILKYNIKDIYAISMPGFGTSRRTKTNAKRLAEALGVTYLNIPIENSVKQHFSDIKKDINEQDIVFENAQARERTQILMDYANKVNAIVIGTGDMSELALGWATYNGDHISMYGINSGIPKTLVKYIISWVAEEEFCEIVGEILNDIITTPISPELLPTANDGSIIQKTEESIGPYLLHDFFLYYFIRFGFSPSKIYFLASNVFESVFSNEEIKKWLTVFYQRFFSQQYKRSCLPDGPKVGSVALSPRGDWRMPSDASVELWINEIKNI